MCVGPWALSDSTLGPGFAGSARPGSEADLSESPDQVQRDPKLSAGAWQHWSAEVARKNDAVFIRCSSTIIFCTYSRTLARSGPQSNLPYEP